MPDQFAPFPIPASPQAFTFGGQAFVGYLTSWSGATERRYVIHRFPKRPGQRVEDMERDGRWLQVRLLFIGPDCAKAAQKFEAFVDQNPQGRLDHPVAGTWTAFCLGPQSSVDFGRALNEITVDVKFIESETNAKVASTAPDVGTAAQNVSNQQTAFQQSVANFMGALGNAQTQVAGQLGTIGAALALVNSLPSPVATLQAALNATLGAGSQIAGIVNSIRAQSDALNADATSFVTAAIDLFSGSDTSATASADNIANTLGIVQADAQTLEDTLTQPMPSVASRMGGAAPAGAAQAVRDIESLVEQCLVLQDAVFAQLPPIVQYTVPSTIGLMILSQRLMTRFGIVDRDPLSYASALLGLNRIPFPQSIPAGTVLAVPTA